MNRMLNPIAFFVLMLLSPLTSASDMTRSASPDNANLYIISPANRDTVGTNVTVRFGLKGMGVSPAGFDKKSTGHHHLIIDGKHLPKLNKPMGKEVKHFGGGQTETALTLSPGKHTLQLILGNYAHVPHQPAVVSEKITIHVK